MLPPDREPQDLEITALDPIAPHTSKRPFVSRWMRSWFGRLTLSTLTALIVLSALVGMLAHVTPDPLGALEHAFGGSTPTPTPFIPPGGDEFGVINWVPWGVLRIDGRTPTITLIPAIGRGFALSRGVHHLVYQARYFPTVRCIVSVPQSPDDTCPLANSAGVAGVTFLRILDLRATPARLSLDQYKLLFSNIESILSDYAATTTIQAGERYIDQYGQGKVATTVMRFTLGVRLTQRQDLTCPVLCPTTVDGADFANIWFLAAQVDPTWTVTDSIRRTFSPPLTPLIAPSGLTLAVTPDRTGWGVTIFDKSMLSSFAQEAVSGAVVSRFGNYQSWSSEEITSGANPADGAVAFFKSAHSGHLAILLWRFGILYAANTEAAGIFPMLPLANKQERELARAMVAEVQNGVQN